MLQIIFSLSTLWWSILLLYIPACLGLIVIVLLQKGKGQGLAGAFGMGGGMDTIFGPRSSKSLPQKLTYAAAGVFMALALIMSILSGRVYRSLAPELVEESAGVSLESLFDPAAAQAPVAETTGVPAEVPPAAEILVTPAEVPPAAEILVTPAEIPPVEVDLSDATVEIQVPDTSGETATTTPADTLVTPEESAVETPAAEAPVETPAPAPPVEIYDVAPETTAPDTGSGQ